jgi:hypothetical protein
MGGSSDGYVSTKLACVSSLPSLHGRWCWRVRQKKPTLTIGHHLLEGKVAALPKPLAVLRRVVDAEPRPDAMDCDDDASQKETSAVAWDAIAIVKRKIIFSNRPMPIVGKAL